MPESKMKEVAQLLGVELGEKFKIKGYDRTFRFTNDGLFDYKSKEMKFILYKLLKGEREIEKPILDKVEKRYLENLLRPFKDRVTYVTKRKGLDKKLEYLNICLDKDDVIFLPYFKENTMYVGMKAEKQYTLKELGLFD